MPFFHMFLDHSIDLRSQASKVILLILDLSMVTILIRVVALVC